MNLSKTFGVLSAVALGVFVAQGDVKAAAPEEIRACTADGKTVVLGLRARGNTELSEQARQDYILGVRGAMSHFTAEQFMNDDDRLRAAVFNQVLISHDKYGINTLATPYGYEEGCKKEHKAKNPVNLNVREWNICTKDSEHAINFMFGFRQSEEISTHTEQAFKKKVEEITATHSVDPRNLVKSPLDNELEAELAKLEAQYDVKTFFYFKESEPYKVGCQLPKPKI